MRRNPSLRVAACALALGACASPSRPVRGVPAAAPVATAAAEPAPALPDEPSAGEALDIAEQNAIASRTDLERLERELADLQRALTDAGSASGGAVESLHDREIALQAQVERLHVERDAAERARQAAEPAKTQAQTERERTVVSLQAVGPVVERASGSLVLTLPGEALFASGSADLRTAALDDLTSVAHALASLDEGQQLAIESYTDSRGSAAANARLSKRRAEAVRVYLVEQGIAEERVVARGRGEAAASRIEIVVAPPMTVSQR